MTAKSGSPRKPRLSPGRRQYLHFKNKHPDALLLFRIGDFYETFDEDAETMSRVLDIALTARDIGGGVKAPLAGIPHHALSSYLAKLVRAGLKVAIAEQISGKSGTSHNQVLERAVVRIVTPGTVIEPGMLEENKSNYLAAVIVHGHQAGIAYVDLTTSDFATLQTESTSLLDTILRLSPAEVLVNDAAKAVFDASEGIYKGTIRSLDKSGTSSFSSENTLKNHFGVSTLESFGCADKPLAVIAAATTLEFLAETQMGTLPQITSLHTEEPSDHVLLSTQVMEDLEVLEPLSSSKQTYSLLKSLDRTCTPMGKRLIREWLSSPLARPDPIRKRQEQTEQFFRNPDALSDARAALSSISDLERLINRCRSFTAHPRDVLSLAKGISNVPALSKATQSAGVKADFGKLTHMDIREISDLVAASVLPDAPLSVGEGNTIKPGFDDMLDEVRSISSDTRSRITAMETAERERTGIKPLRIKYNRVFGYCIEVSRGSKDKIPPDFEPQQTLATSVRFSTPALKELESRILRAREQIEQLEKGAFQRVCGELTTRAEMIMSAAKRIAELDAICGLAEVALEKKWIRPEVDNSGDIEISGGRHPIVEDVLGPGRFVPNDVSLSTLNRSLMIITGPNMSGKSTYIRMVATLALMAQMGSFIPADKARIGVIDRIFTRSGLSDDISGNRSTFMVEMVETASILNQASPRSLVVFDEIGRGTSTYDGLAIAQAVAEHIHNGARLGCRTLFATHFHEMTSLGDSLPKAANYQVAVAEKEEGVIFLHRIAPGGANRSYGVYVARLAGLPSPVVHRAQKILDELESGKGALKPNAETATQISLFTPGEQRSQTIIEKLQDMRLEEMTPIEAMNALAELQKEIKGTTNRNQ